MTDVLPADEIAGFAELLGSWTEPRTAPYPVSLDAIRRFVQAAMLPDDVYGSEAPDVVARYGGVIAPPLYPLSVFVRPLGTPDPLERLAGEPDWDAAVGVTGFDLPVLRTSLEKTLNGGTEAYPVQLARVGDVIGCRARYLDITPRQGKSGPLLVVRVEAVYTNQDDATLLRTIRTMLRR